MGTQTGKEGEPSNWDAGQENKRAGSQPRFYASPQHPWSIQLWHSQAGQIGCGWREGLQEDGNEEWSARERQEERGHEDLKGKTLLCRLQSSDHSGKQGGFLEEGYSVPTA